MRSIQFWSIHSNAFQFSHLQPAGHEWYTGCIAYSPAGAMEMRDAEVHKLIFMRNAFLDLYQQINIALNICFNEKA